MKKLIRFALALGVLFTLALVGAYLLLGRAVEEVVNRGGSEALGTETQLGNAEIGLFKGQFGLGDLTVGNPEGFEAPSFLELGKVDLDLPLWNLTGDVVEIPSLAIENVALTLERNDQGRWNYDEILAALKRFSGGDAGDPAPSEEETAGEGKRFIVRDLRIDGVTLELDMGESQGLIPGGGSFTLAPIHLENVDSSGEGLSISELSALLVNTLLASSLQVDGIPDKLISDFGGYLQDVQGQAEHLLEAKTEELIGELDGKIESALSKAGLGDALGGAGLQEILDGEAKPDLEKLLDEKVGGGLGDLLKGAGGDDDPEGGGSIEDRLEGSQGQLENEIDEVLQKGAGELEKGLGGLLGGKKKDG